MANVPSVPDLPTGFDSLSESNLDAKGRAIYR